VIAVIGAGAWGTTLAQVFARGGRATSLWARDPALAQRIGRQRRNPAYLPGIRLDDAVLVTAELADALHDAVAVILAVPTQGMRQVAAQCLPFLAPGCPVVSAAKGFETTTCMRMSQVLAEVMGEIPGGAHVAAISGPNIAIETARGLPAATVVASSDPETAAVVRDLCNGTQLRFYSNDDLVGVEYGGALKNIVAIAAGICDGIGVGDNAKAALITRGLAEMARLGVCAGAQPLTFAGLTGLGDCVVTCVSPYSRNRRLGEAIARGQTLAEVESGMSQVAEGVNAARVARELAARFGVEMPIVTEVSAVLFEAKPIADAVADLMRRGARDELREFGLEPLSGRRRSLQG
jgi:glycerol-3-phosphate dehydrogenase (NAD(P)+)